ncbi:hypothetical protein [Rhizobium sp. NRK18]|jgi:hypothetical protein|uniref:hypothetical protein n=1 Tax=Rhizobium sp. NRK18 TaxID=2964667 RepID=UPI0021C4A390|nr:hypothetical protein [Rhizobium sp. NRK18]MCQ2003587.1 hypothetical protein [Rhizobium sp. NRK18]
MANAKTDRKPVIDVATESPRKTRPLKIEIERLAEDLRAASDLDLPHSYFVEQAKLKLGGHPEIATGHKEAIEGRVTHGGQYQSPACFNAWAMPD